LTMVMVPLRMYQTRPSESRSRVTRRVWYIRNGTITRVGNESQGWSRAYMDVPVAYSSDITMVKLVLEQVAEEIWADVEFRETMIVEHPEVVGVEKLSDSTVVFRLSAKTLPARQAQVARELRLRVKTALDSASIPMVPSA